MAGAILYANLVTLGVGLNVFSAVEGSASCLLDPQPSNRARWAGGAATVLIDFGGPRPIDGVAALSTTLGVWGSLSVVRLRLSTVDATGEAGDAWDTGTVPTETNTDNLGNLVLVRAAGPVTARYLLLQVIDGSAPLIDIGLVVAGALWRMSQAPSYGYAEGRMALDTRATNGFTGAQFPVPARLNPRAMLWKNDMLSRAEGTGALRALTARVGAARDVLWVPDTGLSQAELNARSLWGPVGKPGDLMGAVRTAFPGWTRNWDMVERG